MGLQCSILGHAFEPAGVEREREEQGSEVVTTEREIQRCSRCGTERVVSESTEVAAVVDASEVDLETDDEDDAPEPDSGAEGGIAGVVDRSDAADDLSTKADDADGPVDEPPADPVDLDDEPPDPDEEDAEILTDDDEAEPERQPGQWPDDLDADTEDDEDDEDAGFDLTDPGEQSLSGITVPEGEIVCPECSFSIEANSGYRDGDPCPECNAWLEAERNQ